jgi:hypothetical protein
MQDLTKAQKGRIAIREFSTIAEALALRGYYRPSGSTGHALEKSLRSLSPEIYGAMNDPRAIELKGLEYVVDRLPRGIEACTRIVLTAQEELAGTSFQEIIPLKRRRTSYRLSDTEICFVVTRGLSEIYDILTHLTFLNIEAGKIRRQIDDEEGSVCPEWHALEEGVRRGARFEGEELDRAVWNLSMILGRTYQETRATYEYLEKSCREGDANSGLFSIVYHLGKRVKAEEKNRENMLLVYFTPSLKEIIGQQKYGRLWAAQTKRRLIELGLTHRPLHIISANLHSVVNLLYGFAAVGQPVEGVAAEDLPSYYLDFRDKGDQVRAYAREHGFWDLPDESGVHIDCQLIDTARLDEVRFHPAFVIDRERVAAEKPVLLVMDYAFGVQAGELMDELLNPLYGEESTELLNVRSVSVMGKAGILCGNKGDIMLATAHVLEGTAHNYTVDNDLTPQDFDESVDVYTGPVLTVLGTSLQNRDVLERFQTTSWRAIGLEMEGGHYQRAISAAIVKGHVPGDIKVRYGYYASDNPLKSGQTLASGSMGKEGVRPTYMITSAILEKILNG